MDAPCAKRAKVRKMTKELFLLSMECPTRGWKLRCTDHREIPTPGERERMMQGQAIHRRARARALYPEGVFAATKEDSVGRTARFMADPSKRVLFEAAFDSGPLTVRTDILVRQKGGWHLIEVKSNCKLEEDLLQDIGFSTLVLRRAGVNVIKASLLLVSPDFLLGMPNEKLFRSVDATKEAFAWADKFDRIADKLAEDTSAEECPTSPLTKGCKDCPFYKADCLGAGIDFDILQFPRISNWRLKSLTDARVLRIADVPSSPGLLTPTQSIVRKAVVSNQPVIDQRQLRTLLSQVRFPACYLDFEAVATAIPLYENVKPYQTVATQYSAHFCDRIGHVTDHREFLADAERDCRRELAQRLCDDLDGAKSIIVYSAYERTTLRALAKLCPDLKDRLDGHATRIFDLEKCLLPKTFYDPKFRGSSSIKAVLPILCPGFNYEGLKIADGDHATAKFAQMARGEFSDEQVAEIRRELLAYCGLDSLAMVKLHEALVAHC